MKVKYLNVGKCKYINLIMYYKIFSNSIEENKIPPETYKKIYKIIIENYAIREKLSEDELKKLIQ